LLQIILFFGRLLFLALAFYFLYFIVKKTLICVNIPSEIGEQKSQLCLITDPGETEILTTDGTKLAVGDALELPSPIRIGRQESNAVIIKNSFVSAHHAIIESDHTTWWLRDLKSKNGTRHNGRPVKDRVQLEPNDYIEVAGVEFSWRR
jgi:hypothetical protein